MNKKLSSVRSRRLQQRFLKLLKLLELIWQTEIFSKRAFKSISTILFLIVYWLSLSFWRAFIPFQEHLPLFLSFQLYFHQNFMLRKLLASNFQPSHLDERKQKYVGSDFRKWYVNFQQAQNDVWGSWSECNDFVFLNVDFALTFSIFCSFHVCQWAKCSLTNWQISLKVQEFRQTKFQ